VTRRRRARVAAAAVALGLVTAGCYGLNGRLPPESLTTVTPSCSVVSELAQPLVDMMTAAQAEGIPLQPETQSYLPPEDPVPPRIESCYRTFEMQQWWRDLYCSKGACGFAAVPGTSRHGWGRAVDFEDEQGYLNFFSPGYVWLTQHAHEYGFYQPEWAKFTGGAPEAWHWER